MMLTVNVQKEEPKGYRRIDNILISIAKDLYPPRFNSLLFKNVSDE